MDQQNQPGVQTALASETALISASGRGNEEKRPPVPADSTDFWFAVIYTVVGYSLAYLFSSDGFGWKFSVFTAVYALVALSYLFRKKKKIPKESWFWLAMMLGSGLPYGFYTAMPVFQVLGTAALAAYWTLAAGGCLLENDRTSQWAAADFWNGIWRIPFGNFACYFHVLAGGGEKTSQKAGVRKLGAILCGFLLAIPVLLVVLPLLSSADNNFSRLLTGFMDNFSENVLSFVLRAVFSLPVTAYLFGLAYGCVHCRKTDRIRREAVRRTGDRVRMVPDAAVYTALLTISVCYVLFMVLQGQYLFSAFAGIRPEMYTYSEYARKGFFELCGVAAVNLAVLLAANLFTKTDREYNRTLRWLNLQISVLTLLLIGTAASKMVLYISAYGLTIRRIQTMVFMGWLAVVFLLWCAGQREKLPMIRTAVMSGAGLYVLLCVLPLEEIVTVVNAMLSF